MQDHAPRVFRWVEHMQVPEIAAPEFFDTEIAFFADDAVPDMAVALLNHIADTYGAPFLRDALALHNMLNGTNRHPGRALMKRISTKN